MIGVFLYFYGVDDFLFWFFDVVQLIDLIICILVVGFVVLLEISIFIGFIVLGDIIVIIVLMGVVILWEGIVMGVVVVVGVLIGESIGFWFGCWLGLYIWVLWFGCWIGEYNWVCVENYFVCCGGIVIFFLCFFFVLYLLVLFIVGMSEYLYWCFLVWIVLVCIIWVIVYVSVILFVVGSFCDLVDCVYFVGYIFVGVIVLFLLLVYFGKKLLQCFEVWYLEVLEVEVDVDVKD